MSHQTKVKIIREYETKPDDQPADRDTRRSKTSHRSNAYEKPMKINVIKEHNKNKNDNQHVATNQVVQTGNFTDMQTKMEMELDMRRRDWEKDVMKMQQEFFKMPSALKDHDTGDGNPIAIHSTHLPSPSTGTEILDISNTKDLYTYKPDGSRVYNLRFNVKGFTPREINVKAEGKKLNVTAKHEEAKDSGQKSTRNFNRQMDIPAGVEIDGLIAELSTDGILCIEAPVNEMGKHIATDVRDLGNIGNIDQTESYTVGDPFNAVKQHMPGFTPNYNAETERSYGSVGIGSGPQSAFSAISYEHDHGYPGHTCHSSSRPKMHHYGHYSSPHIEEVNENARKLKLEVDIGSEYKPDEVNVTLEGHHIHVTAVHEEKTASGRTAKREFSRTFESPDRIDPTTMRAVISADGWLMIGASLTSNKDHHVVLEAIKSDMPRRGKHVNITY